jgi:hypothetical protein
MIAGIHRFHRHQLLTRDRKRDREDGNIVATRDRRVQSYLPRIVEQKNHMSPFRNFRGGMGGGEGLGPVVIVGGGWGVARQWVAKECEI